MEGDFASRLIECVDRALESIGKYSKISTYWYIEHVKNLKKQEILVDPVEFTEALVNLYGSGATILERSIIREIEKEFSITTERDRLVEVLLKLRERNRSSNREPIEDRTPSRSAVVR